MGFKEANNSLALEDVEAFQKINIKYSQKYVEDYKKWVEKEASLLGSAHIVIDFYDYWYLYQKESVLKPILVWKYWKNREVLLKNLNLPSN